MPENFSRCESRWKSYYGSKRHELIFLEFWLCSASWEEGEDDARSACPSDTLGYTRDTIASTTGSNAERRSKSLERVRQFGLRSAIRPHETGIASNHRSAILWWIRSQVLYSGRHAIRYISWWKSNLGNIQCWEAKSQLFVREDFQWRGKVAFVSLNISYGIYHRSSCEYMEKPTV